MSDIVFTQKMTMHLNGGRDFSELHFRVFANGEPTSIVHLRRTNGRPKYTITQDLFFCGDDPDGFDVLETRGVGLRQWLLEHVGATEGDERTKGDIQAGDAKATTLENEAASEDQHD